MRIRGVYPPPLPRSVPAVHVTRYGRRRRRPATRAWTAVSASLATAGVSVLLLAPAATPAPVRQEVAASTPAVQVPAVQVPVVPVTPGTAPPVAPAPLLLAASAPVSVDIPVLRAGADVVDLGLQRDGTMETPTGAEPVGWYTGSPTPGALGPAVLAGHVDWDGEPGTFYGLRELLPGDEISVLRADGTTAVFAVDRVEEHGKDAFPSDEVYGDTTDAQLRLITCGGSFDEETGDYLDNVVVFATLVAVR